MHKTSRILFFSLCLCLASATSHLHAGWYSGGGMKFNKKETTAITGLGCLAACISVPYSAYAYLHKRLTFGTNSEIRKALSVRGPIDAKTKTRIETLRYDVGNLSKRLESTVAKFELDEAQREHLLQLTAQLYAHGISISSKPEIDSALEKLTYSSDLATAEMGAIKEFRTDEEIGPYPEFFMKITDNLFKFDQRFSNATLKWKIKYSVQNAGPTFGLTLKEETFEGSFIELVKNFTTQSNVHAGSPMMTFRLHRIMDLSFE